MAEEDWAMEEDDTQCSDSLSLESLFLMGLSSSPRKRYYFVDNAKERNESMTLPPPSVSVGIKRGQSVSKEENGDEFIISCIKRGRSVGSEEADQLSKRKLTRDMSIDIPEGQMMESPLSTPRSSGRNVLVHASPRVIRTRSEDGSSEQEFQLSTPIVRHSRSLALRRVCSVVYTSPQFQLTSPSPRRRCSYGSKPPALERLKSEDRMSEGSSSGRESMDIDTDDDMGRLESIGDESEVETMEHGERNPPNRPVNKLWSPRPPMATRLPFHLKRQESDLFEDDPPPVSAKDIAFLQGQDKGDDPPKEFKLNRRWNGRSSITEGTPPSRKRSHRKDRRVVPPGSCTESKALHRCARSTPLESQPQEQRIKSVVETFCRHDSNLIADGTAPYVLPCFRGKKEELMFISCHTLADVVQGRYEHVLDHYEIIDCRYPYEYAGGHIIGALNMFRAENIGEIMSWKDTESNKRNVLIFHCEFSSQRGPSMMRLLRSTDRKHNENCYPYLCHPEIYLLEGGYKEFYAKYTHLCEPQNYVPMVHSDYTSDLKKFHTRSTSWHGKDLRFSKHSHTLLI
ncbi:uncharacterized protein LOC143279469 [Babylonia areolata]|uniref:uncharacterized protein LOC143279469 n=1 Tax=Babylonia areolata TaxID=304850 RepID=UPI003FD5FA92